MNAGQMSQQKAKSDHVIAAQPFCAIAGGSPEKGATPVAHLEELVHCLWKITSPLSGAPLFTQASA